MDRQLGRVIDSLIRNGLEELRAVRSNFPFLFLLAFDLALHVKGKELIRKNEGDRGGNEINPSDSERKNNKVRGI